MSTLRTVLDQVASFINQDPSLVTGTDLTSQVNFINLSQKEWADTYEWDQLRLSYSIPVTYSGTSVALPSNFKKLMSPVYDKSLTSSNKYEKISSSGRFTKSSSDKYIVRGGNDATGYYLLINPPMASGASLVVDYQSHPSSAATVQDVMVCPSDAFLTARTISKVLAARSDERFPTFKAESDDILSNLIEDEAAFSGAQNNRTPDYFTKNNFIVGVD